MYMAKCPATTRIVHNDSVQSVGDMRNAPAPLPARGARGGPSVGRVPDDREGVGIVLPGGAAEVGVELARPELRGGEAQ